MDSDAGASACAEAPLKAGPWSEAPLKFSASARTEVTVHCTESKAFILGENKGKTCSFKEDVILF